MNPNALEIMNAVLKNLGDSPLSIWDVNMVTLLGRQTDIEIWMIGQSFGVAL